MTSARLSQIPAIPLQQLDDIPYFHEENSYLRGCQDRTADVETVIASAHGLDKGDLVDFLQSGESAAHFVQRRFAQEPHAVFAGGAPDLRRRLSIQNHLADPVGQIQEFMNCRPAPESRPRALDAALPLVQRNLRPLLRVQTARLEHVIRIMHSHPAGIADDSYQPLRQNTVQRRHKVVRLDAHVQEAPQHVHYVIGVDGCEHEVTRERRLDRDLRGLVIANFAHHDFVRVVTQNGTQTAGEGQTLFFVDRNLGDAAQLILDWIFNGDDLVFVGLDFVDGGVERRGFAAARRPGDQHHAVRLLDIAAEAAQVVFVEPDHFECELLKLLAHRLLVEHAEHGVLAVDRGHDRNAEVDGARVVLDAEAAVLGHAALGNIELAHDLDARNDGGMVLFADGRHGVGQHAVNTKRDVCRAVPRLDMEVACPP